MPTPRETKAQKERATLEEFRQALSALPDPRRAQGRRYPLFSVVTIALMAMVSGCDDAEAFDAWGEHHEEWLSKMLPLPHGTPSQDVYLAVFAALDPRAFNVVFAAWVELLKARLSLQGKHIAVDGKTSRRSFDRTAGLSGVHTVSAWLSEAGLVLGQVKTREKSNEIKAIPELCELIDIRGTTVTIDAMGCHTAIVEKIREGGGHYLIAVKDNQPTLHADIRSTFEDALDASPRPEDRGPRPSVEKHEETEKGHGRIETRSTFVCRELSCLQTAQSWRDLRVLVMVIAERIDLASGEMSREARYYIGSDAAASAQEHARLIRAHWGIENSLHWVLDMAFREDEARHRAGNLAANLATLR